MEQPIWSLNGSTELNEKFISFIQKQINIQEGTLTFHLKNEEIYKNLELNSHIYELVGHGHIHKFVKEKNKFKYYYSSLNGGTKESEIEAKKVTGGTSIFIAVTWKAGKSIVYMGSKNPDEELVTSEGVDSLKRYRALKGKVIEFDNVNVNSLRFYSEEGNIEPTAIDGWEEIKKGIDTLNNSYSDYQHELIGVNLSIASLITGFENYLKKRFIEIEKEGVVAVEEKLISIIFSKWQRENNYASELKTKASEEGITFIEKLALKEINFQNYDDAKKAYTKAYGLKFSELGIKSNEIEKLKKFIGYRHKITHISPMTPILNSNNLNLEEPIFPNKNLLNEGIKLFDDFIKKLHEKSKKIK